MKNLLTVTAILEFGAGLMFEVQPSQMSVIVLGISLSTPAELTYAHAFGITLLAMAVGCWLTRNDGQGHTVRGVVGGLVVFEAGIVIVLSYASIVLGMSSIFLWPFILVHLAMTVWCIMVLRKQPEQIIVDVK